MGVLIDPPEGKRLSLVSARFCCIKDWARPKHAVRRASCSLTMQVMEFAHLPTCGTRNDAISQKSTSSKCSGGWRLGTASEHMLGMGGVVFPCQSFVMFAVGSYVSHFA